jgi:hypothetical protein
MRKERKERKERKKRNEIKQQIIHMWVKILYFWYNIFNIYHHHKKWHLHCPRVQDLLYGK